MSDCLKKNIPAHRKERVKHVSRKPCTQRMIAGFRDEFCTRHPEKRDSIRDHMSLTFNSKVFKPSKHSIVKHLYSISSDVPTVNI